MPFPIEGYREIRKRVKEEQHKSYFKCDGLAKVIEELKDPSWNADRTWYGLGHADGTAKTNGCAGTCVEGVAYYPRVEC